MSEADRSITKIFIKVDVRTDTQLTLISATPPNEIPLMMKKLHIISNYPDTVSELTIAELEKRGLRFSLQDNQQKLLDPDSLDNNGLAVQGAVVEALVPHLTIIKPSSN